MGWCAKGPVLTCLLRLLWMWSPKGMAPKPTAQCTAPSAHPAANAPPDGCSGEASSHVVLTLAKTSQTRGSCCAFMVLPIVDSRPVCPMGSTA